MDPADDEPLEGNGPDDENPDNESDEDISDFDPEEDGDSDEELPNIGMYGGGGGELMLVNPANPVALAEQIEAEMVMAEFNPYSEMEIDGIHDRWHEINDAALVNILQCVCSYLSFREIRELRLVSPKFNLVLVNKIQRFYKHCKGKYSTTFYKTGQKTNSQMAMHLNEATLQNFVFFRKNNFFKKHWQLTSTDLETLEMDNCTLECDGLKFLVDFAPNLKKLSIKYCRLRDLDNFHERPRLTPVTKDEIPKYLGITSLHLEGVKVIENCFMQYLIEKIKPNTLIELNLCKSFIEETRPPAGTILAAEYFRHFSPLFVTLIMKNARSLKKMAFQGNAFQMIMLQKLTGHSEAMRLLEPTHLSLALQRPVPEELNWNHLCQFLRDRCLKLQNLNLKIIEDEKVENVRNIIETLTLINCPLTSFNFEFKGNSKGEIIELEGLMNKLTELNQLTVTDTKSLDPNVKYIVGGARFWRYRLHSCFGYTPAHSEKLVRDSKTNVPATFLSQLPKKITKLCLKGFMPETNIWLELFQNPACMESFNNLTKLEIFGPYFHCMHLVVPQILTLENLETLALSNCDIQDTYITGLGISAVMDLRRCLMTAFTIIAPGTSSEDLEKIIHDAPYFPSSNESLKAPTPRPQLSKLKKLKSLDLSDNPQLSDVGIYDSMRLPLVENLILKNCDRITDNGLHLIGTNFPSLQYLNVRHCRKMSKFGINELIKVCRNLKRIHTTKVVTETKFKGFKYNLCPSFDSIVRTSNEAKSEGFINEELLDT